MSSELHELRRLWTLHELTGLWTLHQLKTIRTTWEGERDRGSSSVAMAQLERGRKGASPDTALSGNQNEPSGRADEDPS